MRGARLLAEALEGYFSRGNSRAREAARKPREGCTAGRICGGFATALRGLCEGRGPALLRWISGGSIYSRNLRNEKGPARASPSGKQITMLDYIAITKYLEGKDTPYFANCKWLAAYNGGGERYAVEGCEQLEAIWNERTRILKIRGSVPYFIQGHNFACDKATFVEAVDHLQARLKTGLWDAFVDAVEVGAIFEVERRPKEYIKNHHARRAAHFLENAKPKDKGNFKWWEEGGGDSLKMYDAGRNILMKQGTKRREIIQEAGWNPCADYLKIEAHINRPARVNGGAALLLEDCVNGEKYAMLRARLQELYNELEPMRTLETPTDKSNLRTQDLLALALAEEYMNNHNCGHDEARKALFERINAMSEEILTKADKDARKRQIRAIFGKMQEAAQSEFDLNEELAASLANENW